MAKCADRIGQTSLGGSAACPADARSSGFANCSFKANSSATAMAMIDQSSSARAAGHCGNEASPDQGLLQAAKLDFDSPPHFVELDHLLDGEIPRIQHTRQQADLGLADADLHQSQPQGPCACIALGQHKTSPFSAVRNPRSPQQAHVGSDANQKVTAAMQNGRPKRKPTKPASPQNSVFVGNFPACIISMTWLVRWNSMVPASTSKADEAPCATSA